MNSVEITIGIPTYNRGSSIRRELSRLIEGDVLQNAKILVIDDASTDDTAELLIEFSCFSQVRVLRNDRNLGYAGNFLQLLSRCDTQYLLISADDDEVIFENLNILKTHLSGRSPALLSTLQTPKGAVAKNTKEHGVIRPGEVRKFSAHAPGLVWDTNAVKHVTSHVEQLLSAGNAAAFAYPQVLLASLLVLEGAKCEWWGTAIVRTGEELRTGIRSMDGTYMDVGPRWQQEKAFIDFYKVAFFSSSTTNEGRMAQAMLNAAERRVFGSIRSAIERDRPDLLQAFDVGGRRQYRRLLRRRVISMATRRKHYLRPK